MQDVMVEVEVIENPAAAQAVLDPIKADILEALVEPGSATTVADRLALPRQKVNYHLRALETLGLVTLVEERQRRGLTERVMTASARSYVVSPAALGANGPDPDGTDRLSAQYLIAVAARLIREVGQLASRAAASSRSAETLAIDSEIRFASAADRAAFTEDLANAVTALAGRYHDAGASRGRWHRLIVAAHPVPPDQRLSTHPEATT